MESINIYQMYINNGNRVGFYVVRNSWSRWYAKVIEIAGKTSGPLPGEPPYHGNPKVYCEMYFAASGRRIEKRKELTCPGTFAYTLFVPN